MTPKTAQGLASWTDSDLSKVEWSKRYIRREMREHKGRDNAVSANDLAQQVPVSASTVRDIMQILVDEGLLLGSRGQGYYLIETTEEYVHELDGIMDEIKTRRARKEQLVSAWKQ